MKLSKLEDGFGNYDIVYADPPWGYYGSKTKDAAAGKHYDLMADEDIKDLQVKSLFKKTKKKYNGALFLWATCPKLDLAISTIESWGLHYRGVAFVWVKTRKDGNIIYGQGVPPTATKPTTELCLLATTNKYGRPHKLKDAAVPQVILHSRGKHSEKPAIVREHIHKLYGPLDSIELFARDATPGWDRWGLEAP